VKSQRYAADYAQRALSLGALVRRSGLAQTLAFLERKKDPERELAKQFCALLGLGGARAASELPAFEYALCTRRALELADYFKRFAESALRADRGAGSETDEEPAQATESAS
jgi:CRISPR/Cas system CMR-associated protein Cmr5 small subunit